MRLALTEYIVKNACPKDKVYLLSDGGGLYLQVSPNGSKYWIVRIYVRNKEVRRSLGTYPKVSLKSARLQAFELKQRRDKNYSQGKSIYFFELRKALEQSVKARCPTSSCWY